MPQHMPWRQKQSSSSANPPHRQQPTAYSQQELTAVLNADMYTQTATGIQPKGQSGHGSSGRPRGQTGANPYTDPSAGSSRRTNTLSKCERKPLPASHGIHNTQQARLGETCPPIVGRPIQRGLSPHAEASQGTKAARGHETRTDSNKPPKQAVVDEAADDRCGRCRGAVPPGGLPVVSGPVPKSKRSHKHQPRIARVMLNGGRDIEHLDEHCNPRLGGGGGGATGSTCHT